VEKLDFDQLAEDGSVEIINEVIRDGRDTEFGQWVRWRISKLKAATVDAIATAKDDAELWRMVGQLRLLNTLHSWLFEEVQHERRS